MNKYRYHWWLLPVLACLLSACSDDDNGYQYPSVKLEFLTAFSGADGILQSVLTDEGKSYPVLEDATRVTIPADSLIRIIGNYEETTNAAGTAGVKLHTWRTAISPLPAAADRFKDGIKTDPADVQSIWLGIDFLNIVLTTKMQQTLHLFHFIEDVVQTDAATGRCDVLLRLYHDAKDDVQAFTKRVYLSIPLRQYAVEGVQQVAIHFSLYTTSEEWKTYNFDYIPQWKALQSKTKFQ